MKKLAIIGLGNFGYALLKHFDVKNNNTFILAAWDQNPKILETLTQKNHHPTLFSNISISENILFDNSIKTAITNADYVLLAVSSQGIEDVVTHMKPFLKKNCVIINTAKSLHSTGMRYSVVIEKLLIDTPYMYAVAAGGTIAADLFHKEPLGIDIACHNKKMLPQLCRFFNSYNLSVYPTCDVVGVEYACAFKNIVSILAGIIKGLGYSYGSETHVISRAAYEIEHLVITHLGGKQKTFSIGSQSWGNDLWMSCTGNTRNKAFGELIGHGLPINDALKKMEQENKTVEGIHTIQILPHVANLSNYPLLNYLNTFFNKNGDLRLIEKIIFNHENQ